MRRGLIRLWLLLGGLYEARCLRCILRGGDKWACCIWQLCTILSGLNCAKIVTSTATIVDKVALSECLLEILTCLRLEASINNIQIIGIILSWASVWALTINCTYSSILMLLTHHKVMCIDFSSFSRLHKLVGLGVGLGLSGGGTKLALEFLERVLPCVWLLSQHWIDRRRTAIILLWIHTGIHSVEMLLLPLTVDMLGTCLLLRWAQFLRITCGFLGLIL